MQDLSFFPSLFPLARLGYSDLLFVNLLFLCFCFLISSVFDWKIIALQCYVGFCCIITGISCNCTYIPSPWASLSPPPPYPLPHAPLSSEHQADTSHKLPILHTVVYICQGYSLSSSHPLLPHPMSTSPFFTSNMSVLNELILRSLLDIWVEFMGRELDMSLELNKGIKDRIQISGVLKTQIDNILKPEKLNKMTQGGAGNEYW